MPAGISFDERGEGNEFESDGPRITIGGWRVLGGYRKFDDNGRRRIIGRVFGAGRTAIATDDRLF